MIRSRTLWFGCLLMAPMSACNLLAPPADEIPETVPDFDAATFSNPSVIDNPLFPHPQGQTRTYRGETADGTEEIIIEVLDDSKMVLDIAVRRVRDRVYLEGVLIEDTEDWFAQDDDGNVWYMGEEVDNYNYDDEGQLIDVTHEGAWEAGKDIAGLGTTALPGWVMKAQPMVGDVYSQEFYRDEAEDLGEVIDLDAMVTLGDGTDYATLQTRDYTPLEPDVNEYKYYASGVGLVLEEVVGGDERIELISVE